MSKTSTPRPVLRRWIKRTAVGLVVIAAVACVGLYVATFVLRTNRGLTFENRLRIPMQMSGTESDGRVQYRLTVDESESEFLPGKWTSTAGVNGPYLGPTLRLRRGEQVDLIVENQLDEMTTMHWHGMHVPARMDGTPHQAIAPGDSWTASFEVDQQAASMWYHPHPHGKTGRQVYRGIAGLLWIDDELSESLDLPKTYGVDDIPLVIQDRIFDDDGAFRFEMSRGAVYGDEIIINGTWNPKVTVEARRIRFRLLNASNARIYYIGFDDNREFHQIATDGGFLAAPLPLKRMVLAPGERAEILVDLSAGGEVVLKSFPEAGFLETLESFLDGAGNGHLDLLKITTKPSTRPAHELPERLNTIERLNPADADVTRPMVLGGPVRREDRQRRMPDMPRMPGNRGIPINGRIMDMSRIDERIRLGDTEIWELTNRTGQPHPFHIHLVQFQVVDRNGQKPVGAELGWKDTVLVHPGDLVRIIMKFERYADPEVPYMYHCHIMEHEDAGMMGQFLVLEESER